MKKLFALLAGLLIASVAIPGTRYLELRANANAYAEANRESDVVSRLRPRSDGKALLLRPVSETRTNGYYQVEIPGKPGQTGWVYKSYVRGADRISSDSGPIRVASIRQRSDTAYGDCRLLFVNGKPPSAPEDATPICEEDNGIVFFASGYSKNENHGLWSAYKLDEDQIKEMADNPRDRPNVKFRQNPQLNDADYTQPRHESYTGTGWDRGHLAPNGAMAWDEDAQKRSFTISNIAPQAPAMNRNIWRCFENSIREWAADSGETYVVVGTTKGDANISSPRDPNEVEINIPKHYIAMVYRSKPSPKAVGVMVPNTEGNLDIRDFMMPVADLESKTGFRFGLSEAVASKRPNPKEWPTRIVKKELLGKLPPIDVQCPRVRN